MTDPWRYERYDPDELAEKMAAAILLDVDPDDSGLIRTQDDRELWSRIAASAAPLLREGVEIIMGYKAGEDDVD